MKKHLLWIVLIVMLLFPAYALCAPFMVCDPQTGITHYKLTGPTWVPATVTAQADGSIKMDVSASIVGSNSLTVRACRTDAVWGELCSGSVPFSFSRPATPDSAANTKLSP